MKGITNWIKRHQVIAFIIFTFLITWPGFYLVFFMFPENDLVQVTGFLAVFSPAFSAMLISAIVDPQPKQGSGRQRWIVFGVIWLISWIIMTLYYWWVEKLKLIVAVILWAILAMLPAWVLSSAFARTPGIRKHFVTLLKPRGGILWYLLAFFTVPALAMLGAGITRLMGGGEVHYRLEGMSLGQSLIFLTLTFLSGFLCTGGINEESGWRGFAMPRLQARFPVIVSITIVWFFWSLWHIPYDLGQGVDPKWMVLNRTLIMFTFSVLFAWVYNRTKGSILAPAIFHPSMNAFGNNLPFTTASVVLYVALAVFAIFSDRMWKKLPSDDPAVYHELQPDEKTDAAPELTPAHL